MSVCLESSVLQKNVNNGADSTMQDLEKPTKPCVVTPIKEEDSILPQKNLAKLVLTTIAPTSNPTLLQKVATSSVLTVVNTTGPLTILKTICSNPGGPSTPQFSLVNTSPLTVGNAIGKPLTVVAASPSITVVKAIPNVNPAVTQVEEHKGPDVLTSSSSGLLTNNTLTDRLPIHNVFVKNTTLIPDLVAAADVEAEKAAVATSIPSHAIKAVPIATASKTSNGHIMDAIEPSNKIKIVGNVLVSPSTVITSASSTSSNILTNKSLNSKPYLQQKMMQNSSLNGTTQKFVNKNLALHNNVPKPTPILNKQIPNKTHQQKLVYPTHKSQIQTLQQVNNNVAKPGIKTLSPQSRGIPSQQIQRCGMGVRTIPPQRPKIANKLNYIGKHAIQAQKFRSPQGVNKMKNVKPPLQHPQQQQPPPVPSNNLFPHRTPQNTGVTYHQALTANIIQSLAEPPAPPRPYDFASRYDSFNEVRPPTNYSEAYVSPAAKPQSNLEALSFVCQAVLLDHNYNAKLPSETVRTVSATTVAPIQQNGAHSVSSYYSPPNSTRNRSSSLGGSTNTLSTLSSTSVTSIPTSMNNSGIYPDDDAASDISCGSDRKAETEGEETDTAPEAEAVGNEDHFSDSITRCICGFLHDDGYMIECDKCKVWQHVQCVFKSLKKLPEDYFCEICDPTKPIDRGKARATQQQWMRDNQDVKFRKESRIRDLKMKERISETDTSDGEPLGVDELNKNRIGIITRRKSENSPRPSVRQRRDSLKSENTRRSFKRKERKMTKKKVKPSPKSPSEDELQDVWPSQTISQMPQLRQWIEHYEEAVTNHYSPELRARISSIRVNGVHSDLSTQLDPDLNRCRVFTQPLTSLKYLVTNTHLLPHSPVIELRGKYMLSAQHRGNIIGHTGALTTRQHAQRPGPFLFFYRMVKDNTEVCVDTRTYGNDARFIRRSCRPNSELQHCIEKGVLHLYIVSLTSIDPNVELTIKHEAHDLAAVGTTHISCACGKPTECIINNPIKKNGETTEMSSVRKRRGRRLTSATSDPVPPVTPKEEVPDDIMTPEPTVNIKPEIEIKQEPPKEEIKEELHIKEEVEVKKEEYPMTPENVEKDIISSPSPPLTRRLANFIKNEEADDKKDSLDCAKKSREDRKIEAYMKIFEQMERAEQRKQDNQAKQAHRRESDPSPHSRDEDKSDTRRRRRKGRTRTTSTTSQSRSNRLNSVDSCYGTSGDEGLLSPNDNLAKDSSCDGSPIKEKESSLSGASNSNSINELKSPVHDVDCNSNCADLPETPLSSACLLVAAAVEPLERGFKFPKTKKGLMNEWLNKSPESLQPSSIVSPQSEGLFENAANGFYGTGKILSGFSTGNCDVLQLHCNAKKRWLRQAISEDQVDSPSSRPDSPPISEMVAPPKKRRLPRESISNDNSPPPTYTSANGSSILTINDDTKEQEDRVEIITADGDGDSPTQVLIDDATLKDRVAEMQQEIGSCFRLPPENLSDGLHKDPRLAKTLLNNSEQLVATVEKNLTILGFEDQKVETVAPIKRKLSINEYRQRKQLSVSEKISEEPPLDDTSGNQLSSPAHKMRPRCDSNSSSTSFMSSDEEPHPTEFPKKTLSAFNSEPTELEKQRECVGLRLKKAFGLSINEDACFKPALNMDVILGCDLGLTPTKRLYSPTFPVPGGLSDVSSSAIEDSNSRSSETKEVEKCEDIAEKDVSVGPTVDGSVKPEMFYTPDDEEKDEKQDKEDVIMEESEKGCDFNGDSSSYEPPFNNPVYSNTFTSFGSVIDDAPYEGRNPSPPPDLSNNVPVSYSPS